MEINTQAVLVAKKEMIINAPVEKVWNLLSDIERWPSWQKNVSNASLEGELKKGSAFRWRAMGMGITSRLLRVEKNKVIAWKGHSIGMDAVHIWRLNSKDGKTHVVTEESLSGWFARMLKLFSPRFLDSSLQQSLTTLKKEAEKT